MMGGKKRCSWLVSLFLDHDRGHPRISCMLYLVIRAVCSVLWGRLYRVSGKQ